MTVRKNGAFIEHLPNSTNINCTTYSKNEHPSFTRNRGENHRFNFGSIMEYGHRRHGYNRYERECECRYERHEYSRYDRDNNNYDREDRYQNYGRGNNGGGGTLPMILGAVLGFLGMFGGNNAQNNQNNGGYNGGYNDNQNNRNYNNGAYNNNSNSRTGNEQGSIQRESKLIEEAVAKALDARLGKGPGVDNKNNAQVGGNSPAGTVNGASGKTKDCSVVLHDTIFTLIQKEMPNASREDVLKFTEKTIEANKTLLDSNLQKNSSYTKSGDYIEIGDKLKLILG